MHFSVYLNTIEGYKNVKVNILRLYDIHTKKVDSSTDDSK